MDEKTVKHKIRSKYSSSQGSFSALPHLKSMFGEMCFAVSILSGRRSMPEQFSGFAPYFMNSLNTPPVPHPTSRIFLSESSSMPDRARVCKIAFSLPFF